MNKRIAAIVAFVLVVATASGCSVRQQTEEQAKLTAVSSSATLRSTTENTLPVTHTAVTETTTEQVTTQMQTTEQETTTQPESTQEDKDFLEKLTQIISEVTEKTFIRKTTTEPSTQPVTKSMRVSGYSKQQIIDYFVLTALNNESGIDIGRVVKWTHRVGVCFVGNYISRDVELVEALCDTLNKISGFPGIYITENADEADIYMMFAGSAELSRTISGFGLLDNGYCGLVWDASFALSKAVIGIDSGMINRGKRDSVICEEFLQAMGLPNDSDMYWESVFRESSDLAEWPSNLDWGIVTVLYNPGIKPGMNEKQAVEVAKLFVKDSD